MKYTFLLYRRELIFCFVAFAGYCLLAVPLSRAAQGGGEVSVAGPVSGADRPLIIQLREVIDRQQAQIDQQQELISDLARRITDIEKRDEARDIRVSQRPEKKSVDLSYEETYIPSEPAYSQGLSSDEILGERLLDGIEISGFGSAGYVWSGDDAPQNEGSFTAFDATLFVTGHAWKNFFFHTEIQPVSFDVGRNSNIVRVFEAYVGMRDPLPFVPEGLLNAKLGRIDVPFGEEYLWQDSVDNVLISHTAAWPYAFDEGLAIHGQYKRVGYIASITDGSANVGTDDDSDKAYTMKVFANPIDSVYTSASFMRGGDFSRSGIRFGSHLQPIGRGVTASSSGTSPSSDAEFYAYEIDMRVDFTDQARLSGNFGQLILNDSFDEFDRQMFYYYVEPLYQLTDKLYIAGRLSQFGTFDKDKGYRANGGPFAAGEGTFGDDVQMLTRFAIGLGYRLNINTLLKLEYFRDDFSLINNSAIDGSDDERDFLGAQMAVSF